MTRDHNDIIAAEARRAAEVMRRGGVVLYPTETVWGIGCDARRSDAVKKVNELKGRPSGKGLIVLVDGEDMLERYIDDVPEVALQLIEAADKPMTIVYDHPYGLAPELEADDGSVAVRVTTDDFCRAMCRAMRAPVVSTSANKAGDPTPNCFKNIDKAIIEGVDYVVDLRHAEGPRPAKASTVIKLGSGGLIEIIRK